MSTSWQLKIDDNTVIRRCVRNEYLIYIENACLTVHLRKLTSKPQSSFLFKLELTLLDTLNGTHVVFYRKIIHKHWF